MIYFAFNLKEIWSQKIFFWTTKCIFKSQTLGQQRFWTAMKVGNWCNSLPFDPPSIYVAFAIFNSFFLHLRIYFHLFVESKCKVFRVFLHFIAFCWLQSFWLIMKQVQIECLVLRQCHNLYFIRFFISACKPILNQWLQA